MTTNTNIKIEVYKDAKGEYRWRLRDPGNGLIIAASTEGYVGRRDAENNVIRLQWLFASAVEFVGPQEG